MLDEHSTTTNSVYIFAFTFTHKQLPVQNGVQRTRVMIYLSTNQSMPKSVSLGVKPKFHLARLDSSRLDTTRHVRRVEPMHFGCVELVEEHSSTGSTRRARLARHVELAGATCNLVMITVIHLLFNLRYSLINWSIH